MVIFLYGPDSYRRGVKLREVVAQYREKRRETDFLECDFSETPEHWRDVCDFFLQPSLFTAAKLAVVREGATVSDGAWRDCVSGLVLEERSFLVFSDSQAPPREFSFLLQEPVLFQEFPLLSGDRFLAFLIKEERESGVSLHEAGRRLILAYAESFGDERGYALIHALKEIALAGFNEPVSAGDISRIISWEKAEEIFPLSLRFLRERGAPRRLFCLQGLLSSGYAPSHIMSMCGALARGREETLALASLDESVKSGELDDETALMAFALRG